MADHAGPWPWTPGDAEVAPVAAPAGGDIAISCARCFAGPDGVRVLAHLRALTLDRALGPEAPADALRHLEGQRQLVLILQSLIDRGRGAAAGSPRSGPPPSSLSSEPRSRTDHG